MLQTSGTTNKHQQTRIHIGVLQRKAVPKLLLTSCYIGFASCPSWKNPSISVSQPPISNSSLLQNSAVKRLPGMATKAQNHHCAFCAFVVRKPLHQATPVIDKRRTSGFAGKKTCPATNYAKGSTHQTVVWCLFVSIRGSSFPFLEILALADPCRFPLETSPTPQCPSSSFVALRRLLFFRLFQVELIVSGRASEIRFVHHGDAQLASLGQLAAGILSGDHESGLLAD